VFAGTTVMVALLSLAVVGIPLVTTLGYTSALVVAVAVAAAVTLLPAILAIVGNRIDAWALPHRRTPKDDQRAHGWERWAHFVGRRPLPCALVAVVVLVALALPTLDLYLGLISISAAFGVVTAVFEKGWGVGIVGLDESVAIVSFMPLMMFAILFGLSMDYEVFLMTHIKEAWERTRDNRRAVVEGVAHTGRVITAAALIMVSVFFAFVLNGDPTVKQFGVGMGVAVAIDATLVRCLLVPAVMTLLGESNWWFPRWLDRIVPNFSIEGEEWFRERDAAGAVPATPEPQRARALR
jgi:uncharacterized membrane protein YdfJ with MMPL/SSD domain